MNSYLIEIVVIADYACMIFFKDEMYCLHTNHISSYNAVNNNTNPTFYVNIVFL